MSGKTAVSSKHFDIKSRAAAAATVMNILFTVVKFLLFFLSGSMAILAEAWHSFTDIVTSLLVFIAVRRQTHTPDEDRDGAQTDSRLMIGRMELLISLGIGVLLIVVAGLLFEKFIYAESVPVRKPLLSGGIFLAFAVGSYCISRFEIRVGKQEGSIGLVSDGMHARADMTASLLTGFALILYSMGLNIDRWVAGLIALFILSFGLETIVNVCRFYVNRNPESFLQYRSFAIIACIFDRQTMQSAMLSLKSFLKNRCGSALKAKAIFTIIITLPVTGIIAGYLSTTFYTVGIREQAVIERFGKPVHMNMPIGPGLHLKMPWPVDRVRIIQTGYIEELNIGNITDRQTRALIWTRMHGTEEAFLSGDNNFFYPYIVLHYRIKDIFQYLYENINPKALLNDVGHRVATALFSRETFYDIATSRRKVLEQNMHVSLQANLDELESGIEILSVNFKDIHPPMSVADAFEGVVAGYQEKQKIINEAMGYKNNIIPESRAKALEQCEAAQSYIIERSKKAEGKAVRFSLALPSAQEKQVARSRIHLQVIREVLRGKTKIVIDPRAGVPEVWMGFTSLFPTDLQGGTQK